MVEYLLLGMLLGISPCMLSLFPVTAALLTHSETSKYKLITYYILSSVAITYILAQLAVYFPTAIVFFQGLSGIILVIAGLVWLDILIINFYISYSTNSGLITALLMPLCAGGCTIPAYALVLALASSPMTSLLMLNIGLSVPLILYVLLYPLPIPKFVGRFMGIFKKLLGLAVLLVGLHSISGGAIYSSENENNKAPAVSTSRNLLLITADWCSACQQLKKNLGPLDKLGIKEYDITKITPDKTIFLDMHNIKYIPVFIELDAKGKEVFRIDGGNSSEKIKAYVQKTRK